MIINSTDRHKYTYLPKRLQELSISLRDAAKSKRQRSRRSRSSSRAESAEPSRAGSHHSSDRERSVVRCHSRGSRRSSRSSTSRGKSLERSRSRSSTSRGKSPERSKSRSSISKERSRRRSNSAEHRHKSAERSQSRRSSTASISSEKSSKMTNKRETLSVNKQYSLPQDLVDAGHAGHMVSWLKMLADQNGVRAIFSKLFCKILLTPASNLQVSTTSAMVCVL